MRYSKQYKDSILLEYSDIMKGLRHAWKEKDNDMISLFTDAFELDNEVEEIDGTSYQVFSYKDPVIQYVLEKDLVLNYELLITRTHLKDALIRAYYEFNYSMKQKLTKYFRRFIDNEISGRSNHDLIQEIVHDEQVYKYIKKFDHFDHFMECKIMQFLEKDFTQKKKKNRNIA